MLKGSFTFPTQCRSLHLIGSIHQCQTSMPNRARLQSHKLFSPLPSQAGPREAFTSSHMDGSEVESLLSTLCYIFLSTFAPAPPLPKTRDGITPPCKCNDSFNAPSHPHIPFSSPRPPAPLPPAARHDKVQLHPLCAKRLKAVFERKTHKRASMHVKKKR
ncbi:hypothetical protein MPH_11459 [Macrophomina phaseolina MS6]|uniref:Uncharacterized protein n=1 Tax=Macrophomina phaseolina (strain MS6) TaxID=1126212 RepID=K2RMN0_MACPH|nr:hypothetical protein MPH_11459 [Macrophomina phaseolina MS6]